MTGLYFEDCPVGFRVEHATRRTVTETDNVLFTTMTMNPAPLHLDHDYASRTEFGQPLVNSMFTLALVVGLSVQGLTQGTVVAQLGLSEAVFPNPVFHGDTISVTSEITMARESKSRPEVGVLEIAHVGSNQRGEVVCRCKRTVLMYRRGNG
jgi:acyl dehydratase